MTDKKCETCGIWFSTESKVYPPICDDCAKPVVTKTKKAVKKINIIGTVKEDA